MKSQFANLYDCENRFPYIDFLKNENSTNRGHYPVSRICCVRYVKDILSNKIWYEVLTMNLLKSLSVHDLENPRGVLQ